MDFNEAIQDILRIGRNIRLYYDRELQRYHIGWAQQFLLLCIFARPGVTPQEMTELFQTEKSSVSKGIRRLHEEGYIRIETDGQDRRSKRLYPTRAAEEVVRYIGQLQEKMNGALSAGIGSEETAQLQKTLNHMQQITKNPRGGETE